MRKPATPHIVLIVPDNLADHFIPRLPVRQWVLSLPKRLRHHLQSDPVVQNLALHIVLNAVATRIVDE